MNAREGESTSGGQHGMAYRRAVCVLSILAQVLLIASLSFVWLELLVSSWLHSASTNPPVTGADVAASDVDMESFARLSMSRFEERQADASEAATSSKAPGGSVWSGGDQLLDSVQIARVPQAGGRHLSAVARKLVGCSARSASTPVVAGAPGCRFPGDPPLGCPGDSLCPKVVGFTDHVVNTTVLADGTIFSLSQLRAPVERLVSAFSYGNEPHCPPCARRIEQTKQDVQECFTTMAEAQGFRNVVGRAYTGHDAYAADVSVCCCDDEPSRDSNNGGDSGGDGEEKRDGMERNGQDASSRGEGEGDRGGSDGGDDGPGGGRDAAGGFSSDCCEETLSSSLAGLCLFNHIALAEAPGTSAVLLLEMLPWVRPDASFFSGLTPLRAGSFLEDRGAHGDGTQKDHQGSTLEVSRHGHDEIGTLYQQYITQGLRDTASALNQVDTFLYDVVSANVCSRLRELGLLDHPAIAAELAASQLGNRCASREWCEGVIDSVDAMMETHGEAEDEACRLFRPVPSPPRPIR
ncbi:unnamed protein product [Scytosiphon promiscuus]